MPRTATQPAEADAPAAQAETPAPETPRQSRGPSVNQVTLIGRLASDPEGSFSPSGTPICKLRIATNERASGPEYHTVVAWDSVATFATKYLHRGRLVYVHGRLHGRAWLASDGTKRYSVEVVAETVTALDRPTPSGDASADEPAS